MRSFCKRLLILLAIIVPGTYATAQCTAPTVSQTINICSPAAGSTVNSPVTVSAAAYDATSSVVAMAVYVDNNLAYKGNGSTVSTPVTVPAGSHYLVVQAWNAARTVFKNSETFTVGTPGGGGASCTLSTAVPSVTICTPTNGATVTSPVHVNAGSTDNVAVTAMQIYVDGTLTYKTTSNYVDTDLNLTAGSHQLAIKGWDASGRSFMSTVSVTVGSGSGGGASCTLSTANPSVTICTPTNGTTVTSPVHVDAGSTDSTAVTAMQIYVDGTLNYSANANFVDTNVTLSAGTHQLAVKAWDASGRSFLSTVSVTVGSTTPPPTGNASCNLNTANMSVTICSPANGLTVATPVRINAGSTDSTPVSAMQVYVDNTLSYSVSANSIDTKLSIPTGTHTLTVKAWDTAGQSFTSATTVKVVNAPAAPPTGLTNLKHIVFMMQENRSFDSYFGRLNQYRADRGLTPEVDGVPLNKVLFDMSGNPVSPYHFRTVCMELLSPAWNESHYAWNNGAMDQFMKVVGATPSTIDPDGTRVMGYYDWTDLPYYYELAFNFATSDRFFSSLMGNTIPNRMYLFAATSFGNAYPATAPSGGWTQPTIFDALDAAGVSWRYYYQDNSVYLSEWNTWQRDSGKVVPIANYKNDIQNEATLPQVIFIERGGVTGLDEHTGSNIQPGAARVADLMNQLMASPSWSSSAFILTFDEAGGSYEHVPPVNVVSPDGIQPKQVMNPQLPGDFNQTGFRVPFVLISPWTKPHYVSHTPMEITSILKLIETRFRIPPLTQRDANAPDMTEFFDFTQPFWLTPPALPVQPTNGMCDFNLEKPIGR